MLIFVLFTGWYTLISEKSIFTVSSRFAARIHGTVINSRACDWKSELHKLKCGRLSADKRAIVSTARLQLHDAHATGCRAYGPNDAEPARGEQHAVRHAAEPARGTGRSSGKV